MAIATNKDLRIISMKLSPDEPATTNRQMADQSSKYNVSTKSYLYVGTLYLAIKRTLWRCADDRTRTSKLENLKKKSFAKKFSFN